MATTVVAPSAVRLVTYTQSDDAVPRTTAITTAVNPPDEAIANGVRWLDENRLPVELDDVAIYAMLNELLTDYAAHRASAVFHAPADTTNTVSTAAVSTIAAAITRANLLKAGLLAHMNNSGGSFHDNIDTTNYTLLAAVDNADDVPTLVTLLRALKAYYNAHRTQSLVHPSNDGVNVVSAADPRAGTVGGPLYINDLTVLGVATLGVGGSVESSSLHTFTGPIVASGNQAYSVKRRQNHGSLGSNTSIDLDYDLHAFADPSVASVDVEVDMSVAVGSVLRCYSTSAAPTNTIVFKYSGITLITFPPAANRAWVDFCFNGLLPEITGYGGGATP